MTNPIFPFPYFITSIMQYSWNQFHLYSYLLDEYRGGWINMSDNAAMFQ